MDAVFDQLAESYDSDFTHSPIGRMQRERVWAYWEQALPAERQRLLELNCGTGYDARWLAAKGHDVLATDISPEMIKAARSGLEAGSNSPRFATCSMQALGSLQAEGPFDFLLSNFGGLNCLDTAALQALSADAATLLAPGGRLIAVVMPDRCHWETLYFLGKGRPGKAFRRWRGKALFDLPGGGSAGAQDMIYYYSPRRFAALFAEHFAVQAVMPVGYYLPPSYLQGWFNTRPGFLHWLGQREQGMGLRPGGARYADHFLIDLKRREE